MRERKKQLILQEEIPSGNFWGNRSGMKSTVSRSVSPRPYCHIINAVDKC